MTAAYLKGPPASPRRGRTQCDGKISFDSPALAARAASRKDNRNHYRCTLCGKWHVGNQMPAGTVRNGRENDLVRYETDLIGKIAYWSGAVPGVTGFGSGALVVPIEIRSCGVIRSMKPNGDCTVEMLKAMDTYCPPADDGKLLALRAGTWSTTQ
jgi:hypothetical protein